MDQVPAMLHRSLDDLNSYILMREEYVRFLRNLPRVNERSEGESFCEEEFNPNKPSIPEELEVNGNSRYLGNFVHPPSGEHPFHREGALTSSASSVCYSSDVPDCGLPVASCSTEYSPLQSLQAARLLEERLRSSFVNSISLCSQQVAAGGANDIKPVGATEGLREQNNNPFKLESISRPVEGLDSHPRSRNSSERDRAEYDDREVPNPECERDSEESLGDGNEEGSCRTIYPQDMIEADVARNYDKQNLLNFHKSMLGLTELGMGHGFGRLAVGNGGRKSPLVHRVRGSTMSNGARGSAMSNGVGGSAMSHRARGSAMSHGARGSVMRRGARGSAMQEKTLGTTAMSSSAASLHMGGPPPAFSTSVLPGMPGLPVPVSSFMNGNQAPSISPPSLPSEAIARAFAARRAAPKLRGEKKAIPNEQKDNRYYERRKKNNAAAKKSRDARKKREDEVAKKADFLEQENEFLKREIFNLRTRINSPTLRDEVDSVIERVEFIEAILKGRLRTAKFQYQEIIM